MNDLTKLIKEAERQGWRVELRRNQHLKWSSPRGRIYYSSSTPTDPRAYRNIRAGLIRMGLRVRRV